MHSLLLTVVKVDHFATIDVRDQSAEAIFVLTDIEVL